MKDYALVISDYRIHIDDKTAPEDCFCAIQTEPRSKFGQISRYSQGEL